MVCTKWPLDRKRGDWTQGIVERKVPRQRGVFLEKGIIEKGGLRKGTFKVVIWEAEDRDRREVLEELAEVS